MTDRHVSRALAVLWFAAWFCLMAIGFWSWIWNGVQW